MSSNAPIAKPNATRPPRRFAWLYLLPVLIALAVPAGNYVRGYLNDQTLIKLDHDAYELKRQKNWPELAKVAERWTTLQPKSADAWFYRAEAAEALEDWESLVVFLDKIPRDDSRAVGALLSKAITEFEKLNRPFDGAKTCDEVLAINPLVMVAHKQTVFFYMMSLQRKEAIWRIRRAIRLRRESPETYVFLVSAHWLNPAALYQNNTIWLESNPNSEIFEVARAMPIYTTAAKDDPKQATVVEHIPPAEKLLEKYPHNPELLSFFINQTITNGDLERVQELVAAFSPEVAETDPRYWRAKAWCEEIQGDLEEAEKSLRRGFELDRYWWVIHFQLHDLLRRQGRLEEAAYFFNAYKISKELSIEITSLNKSPESLDELKFCRELLVLAELIEDDDVVQTLKERVTAQ